MHRTWNATDSTLHSLPWGTLSWIMQVLNYSMSSEGHLLQTNETEHLHSAKWVLVCKECLTQSFTDHIDLKSMDPCLNMKKLRFQKIKPFSHVHSSRNNILVGQTFISFLSPPPHWLNRYLCKRASSCYSLMSFFRYWHNITNSFLQFPPCFSNSC